jgi:branched-chain amino acid aminotransferase
MSFVLTDGKIIRREEARIDIDDHAFRYGDGLFETMRMWKRNLLLQDLHFERLFKGIQLLGIKTPALFTKEKLAADILSLCEKNQHAKTARVRLSVSAGSGGLFDGDNKLHYLVESWEIKKEAIEWNENGLVVGIHPGIVTCFDSLSSLKTASGLQYAVAARFAKAQGWNDCLVKNTSGHIAESTIANIFWVKNKKIFTPPVSEGCVDGVMRRFCFGVLANEFDLHEKALTTSGLADADEVFLTNAIRCIRWVGRCGEKTYTNAITRTIETKVREQLER